MKLTDFLAIYGSALSTLVFLWNATRATSKIKVQLVFAIETIDGKAESGLGVSIQNRSSSPAHIAGVSFVYPLQRTTFSARLKHLAKYKRWPVRIGWCHSSLSNFAVDDKCPASIEPSKAHWIFVREEVIEEVFAKARERRLVVQVQDALWRNKYSKPFMFPQRRNTKRI